MNFSIPIFIMKITTKKVTYSRTYKNVESKSIEFEALFIEQTSKEKSKYHAGFKKSDKPERRLSRILCK